MTHSARTPEENKRLITELSAKGVNRHDIAKQLDLSLSSVDSYRKRLGLTRDRSRGEKLQTDIEELAIGGMNHTRIAQTLGVHYCTVMDRLRKSRNGKASRSLDDQANNLLTPESHSLYGPVNRMLMAPMSEWGNQL